MERKKIRKKIRKSMLLEVKQEIIEKHSRGVRVSDLAREYGKSSSTISTILKHKETIKAARVAKGITVITRKRCSTHEEMEILLLMWIREKELLGEKLTPTIICGKALAIYEDLKSGKTRDDGSSHEPPDDDFKASRGWFENFRKRTGIRSPGTNSHEPHPDHLQEFFRPENFLEVSHSEGDRCNKLEQQVDVKPVLCRGGEDVVNWKRAEEFVKLFQELVNEEGYSAQQVFTCGETGLFWKRLPRRTSVAERERLTPGPKPMRDRVTLALCCNASGDCRPKPLAVYHAENPRAFKAHKVVKDKLPVVWRSHARSWLTRELFTEYVNQVVGPSVETFLRDHGLPLKCLLVVADPAPPHLHIMDDYRFIRLLHLPPHTPLPLQPLPDLTLAFKKLYTKHLFSHCLELTRSTELPLEQVWRQQVNIAGALGLVAAAWRDVSKWTAISAWSHLWPDCDAAIDDGFQTDPSVEEDTLALAESLGLEVDEADLEDLIREQEDATQDPQETTQQEESPPQPNTKDAEGRPTTAEIQDMLIKFEQVRSFIDKHHPDKAVSGRLLDKVNQDCVEHFRHVLTHRRDATRHDKRSLSPPKVVKSYLESEMKQTKYLKYEHE